MSTSSNRPGASTTKQLGSTKNYQYPDTLGQEVAAGQHYKMFTSYESINSLKRSPDIKSSIALYIPAGGLTTTIGQTYEEIQEVNYLHNLVQERLQHLEVMKLEEREKQH